MNSRKYYIILSAVMAAILLTAVIAVAGTFYLSATSKELKLTASHYETKNQIVIKLWDIVRQRSISLQNILLESDPFLRDELYLKHMALAAAFIKRHQKLRQMEHSQKEDKLVKQIIDIVKISGASQNLIAELAVDDRLEAALNEMHKPDYTLNRQKFTRQFEAILAFYQTKTQQAFNDLNSTVLFNIHFILLLTAFVLILSASIGFFMIRRVIATENQLLVEAERHIETQQALEKHRQHLEQEVQIEVEKYRRIEESNNRSKEIAYATGKILEDSLNEIYIFDATTLKFIQVNKAARNNTGFSMQELRRLTPVDLSPEMTIADAREIIRPLLNGQKDIVHFTNTLQRKDKTVYPIEIHLQFSMMESTPVIVAMVLDISERKRIEEGLLSKTKHLEQTQNELLYRNKAIDEHALLSSTDAAGKIIDVNDKFCEKTGYSRDELLAKNHSIVNSGTHPKTFFTRLRTTIANGQKWHGEICNRTKNGDLYWVDSAIIPIKGEDGAIQRYISIGIDITERKKTEQALRDKTLEVEQAHRQLETTHSQALHSEKLASVGQLAAGIAHEINTPIQFVGDNTRFMQESFDDLIDLITVYQKQCASIAAGEINLELAKQADDKNEEIDLEYLIEEVPKAVSQSLEGIERVTKIVRSMKDFSHPGSDQKETIDINQAIESTATVCHNEWKYDAELITDFDPDLVAVPCYPGELNQVILNIVVNAAHAIHDARGNNEALGRISISTKLDNEDYAEIRITDNGSGMPEEVRKRIFEPFFTTKGVGKGSGQGLAIAYSVVVEKHHGTLDVTSEPGKGTTFSIRLPMNDEKAPDINDETEKTILTSHVSHG